MMHRRGMPVCCGEVLRWGALGYDVPVSGGLHHGTLVCWGILPGERAVDALAPLRVSLL